MGLPQAIGIAGYDTDTQQVRKSSSYGLNLDESTYWNTWISRDQYLALYNAFKPPSTESSERAHTQAAVGPALIPAVTPTQCLAITGTVQADSSAGTLNAGFLTVPTSTPPSSNSAGNFCLHFASNSAALGDYCFQAAFQDPATGAALPSAIFAVQAPFPTGTTRVSLVVNSGTNQGRELTALNKSATPPNVSITWPRTGDELTAGPLTITWTATAVGGAPLTYNLSTSADFGCTWTPVDVGLTDVQYTLDTTQIAGGPGVKFLVEASDGLSTGTAIVGALKIDQTPQISVSSSTVDFGQAMVGSGASQQIAISNTGTGPLTVDGVWPDNPAFTLISPALPITIDAGSQQNIDVRFIPTDTDPQQSVLTIASEVPRPR